MKRYAKLCVLICGGMIFATVANADTTNPPPTVPLKGFSAYELRPVVLDQADAKKKARQKAADRIQENLKAALDPIVQEWNAKAQDHDAPRLLIEPRVDRLKKVGGATRFWVGPMAGSSYVTMHVKLVQEPGDIVVAEPLFYQRAQAWSGAFTIGAQDNAMLDRIAQLIASYLRANYDSAVGGPTGEKE